MPLFVLFHVHAYTSTQHPLADNLANRSFIRLPESGGFLSQLVEGYNSADGMSLSLPTCTELAPEAQSRIIVLRPWQHRSSPD
jgi:hypothetical protein